MDKIQEKREKLERRHLRVRKKLAGTTERPRLCVHRTLKHIYAQLIDDSIGRTIVAATTAGKASAAAVPKGGNIKAAQSLGKMIAEKALAAGVKKVVFDRGGYKYHGRVKALADAARKSGLEF